MRWVKNRAWWPGGGGRRDSSAVGEDPRLGQGRVDQRRGVGGAFIPLRGRVEGGGRQRFAVCEGGEAKNARLLRRDPSGGRSARGGLGRSSASENETGEPVMGCFPAAAIGCGRGKARKASHVCAFPRAVHASVCVCVSCGQARGLLCRLHLSFKWPPSVSSLTASGKSAPPAVALRRHLCLSA